MKNNKPIPRSELKVGMRVKLPFAGRFFGLKKKALWFKGTIVKLNYRDGKVSYVEISIRNCHGYKDMGKWASLGSEIDFIYKQL